MLVTFAQIAAWTTDAGPAERSEAMTVDIERGSSIDNADKHSVVFAAGEEALAQALTTSATLIFSAAKVPLDVQDPRLFRVRDPRLAFSLLAAAIAPRIADGIHSTAVIDPSAQVAEEVSIGPGCVVAAGVVIGPYSRIGARVVLEPGTVLGTRVHVQSGAVLGSYGFGYARRPDKTYVLFPQQGTLFIEDDVEIGANSTIDRGALGETRIGQGTKIDNLVHIGHNCRIGQNVIVAAQTGISGSTVVDDGAVLGGQVGIGEHAWVGPEVILGGGAGVLSGKKLKGPGEVFWGRPAQPLKQYLRDLARLRRGR